MEEIFIKILNMSISASWLILVVIAVRLLLKKTPKWILVLLWGLVGLRLAMPFSISAGFSLIPSVEVISPLIGYAKKPAINSGVYVIDQTINPMQIYLFVLCIAWIVGVIAFLMYGIIGFLRLRRMVAEAVRVQDNIWICDHVESPFILGFLHPQIYLPSSLGEEERNYVLAHEQAHLKRKDHLWKLIGFLLLAVHWFNPLVWIAYFLLCRDIEMACDEKVIKDLEMPEKKAYANALVTCSMQRRMVLACPLSFGKVGVKQRIQAVLHYQKPAFWLVLVAGMICLVVAACFLTNPMNDEQDLSFLNYKNAISLIGQNGVEYVINYPVDVSEIQVGDVDDKQLIQYLEHCNWKKRRFVPQHLASPGSIQFVIEEEYRITIYQKPKVSCVQFENQVRYYRIGSHDYETALSLLHPENPSSARLTGRILSIDTESNKVPLYLFEVIEDGEYFKTGNQVMVPLQKADPSPEPMVGDILEVSFTGDILETYPMRLTQVISMQVIQKADPSDAPAYDCISCVMVDGKLYLDTGKNASSLMPLTPDSSFDGWITSEVDGSQLPTQNGQSNFGIDYGYKRIDDDNIALYMNRDWWLFTAEGSSLKPES